MLKIKILAMDVDGTLTDGKIYMGNNGEVMKAFSAKDGFAIKDLLPLHGIIPVIITGRVSMIVQNRADELGIKDVFQGVQDKVEVLKKLCEKRHISLSEVAYIGDDLNDIEAMKSVGLSFCVADAADEVKKQVDVTLKHNGGDGAVRECIEYLIEKNEVSL